jgi:hypothetical protein
MSWVSSYSSGTASVWPAQLIALNDPLADQRIQDRGRVGRSNIGGAGQRWQRQSLLDARAADEGAEQCARRRLLVEGQLAQGRVEVIAEDGCRAAQLAIEGERDDGAVGGRGRRLIQAIADDLELRGGDAGLSAASEGRQIVQQRLDQGWLPGHAEQRGWPLDCGARLLAAEPVQAEADIEQAGPVRLERLQAAQEVVADDQDEAQVKAAVGRQVGQRGDGGGALFSGIHDEELLELVERQDQRPFLGALVRANQVSQGERPHRRNFWHLAVGGLEGVADQIGQRLGGRGRAEGERGALLGQKGADTRLQ